MGPLVAVPLVEGSGLVDDVGAAVGVAAQALREGVHVGVGVEVLVRLVLDVVVAILGQEVAGAVDIEALLLHDLDELHVAIGDGVAEDVHLRAVVVDVELALDVIAGVAHDAAEGVAERGPAAVADVHRADRVGGDELDLGLQALADVGLGEVHALLAGLVQHRVAGGGVEVEVDEAGAGHLDLGDGGVLGHMRHDGIGDLARGAMGELGGLHRHGGRPLAMRSVSRSLEAAVLQVECGKLARLLRGGERGAYQLFNLLRHTELLVLDAPKCRSRGATP